jgi:hypothetical protein
MLVGAQVKTDSNHRYWNKYGSVIELVYTLVFFWAVGDLVFSYWGAFSGDAFPARVRREDVTYLPYLVIFLTIFSGVVFIRMYYVLHEIEKPLDEQEDGRSTEGDRPHLNRIVAGLDPVSFLMERILRLCMIISVLMVAKSSLAIAKLPLVEQKLVQLQQLPRLHALDFSQWMSERWGVEYFYKSLGGYQANDYVQGLLFVLLIIFFLATLFFLWDLIVFIFNPSHAAGTPVFSYMNFKRANVEKIVKKYDERNAVVKFIMRALCYLASRKFRERLFLAFSATVGFCAVCLANDLSVFVGSLVLFGFFLYNLLVNQDSGSAFFFALKKLYMCLLRPVGDAVYFLVTKAWFGLAWGYAAISRASGGAAK